MKNDSDSLKAHSEAKIKLLQEYLEIYIAVIARAGFTDVLHFTDFFCGSGEYSKNQKEGSSLAIVKCIAKHRALNPGCPLRFDCHFNDTDASKVDSTKEAVAELESRHKDHLSITFSTDFYPDLIASHLAARTNAPKRKFFYFIDPFGYKEVELKHIQDLMEGGQSEVLLFQPSSFLHRFASKGTPPALAKFLGDLCPEDKWPTGESVWEHIDHTLELFRERYSDGYVDSFTIQPSSQTVFCLFFFTSHIYGFEKMLEAKWNLNDTTGRGWHYEEAAGEDLFSEPNPQTEQLKSLLGDLLRPTGGVTNREIYEHTIRAGFLPKHANDVLRGFQNAGILRADPEQRKGAFFVNHENFKNGTRIVRFSLVP